MTPRDRASSVAAFARSGHGGLILTASALSAVHRDLIITLAARHKLPAVYLERQYAAAGGLISYGPNFIDESRRAAGYVDRILKGEKPADLPVQAPTKYELAIGNRLFALDRQIGFDEERRPVIMLRLPPRRSPVRLSVHVQRWLAALIIR